jgi:hypothetical protein
MGYGLLSARPAAGTAGQTYFATDTNLLYRDNGTSWNTLLWDGSSIGSGLVAVPRGGIGGDVSAGTKGGVLAWNGAGIWFLDEPLSDGLVLTSDSSTTSGTIWTTGGGGGSLANAVYTRTAGDYTITSSSFIDLDSTNMVLTITTGVHRVLALFCGTAVLGGVNQSLRLDLLVDGTSVSNSGGIYSGESYSTDPTTPINFSWMTAVLGAGSHTFKVRVRVSAGATGIIIGGTSGLNCQFSVQELSS